MHVQQNKKIVCVRYPSGTKEHQKAGQPLAAGFFGLLFGLTGDLDYQANVLSLPHYTLKKGCCSVCKCDEDGDLSWTDFRFDAGWVTSHWSRDEWRAWPNRSRCQLFDLPGGFSAMVALDLMHGKYLGTDQFMYGSILAMLVQWILPSTPESNLSQVWNKIQEWYRNHQVPVRFKYLTKLSMFIRKTGFPKLRGKAAEIRYFAGPMLHVWEQFHNPHIELHKRTLKALDKQE